ncbi:hypothetical protein MNEG_12091 [Monoraphidium neglectum]|uniref:Uncharacterized protein n=1 Tax=Monoraphidium neglectum TaxID=145388 RepID=A0A0D2MM35_9CHLO|nr:hypothetical protein MNEG_12091 [Monoraphidium neglectum]KIY95870.1 hypothetical protein MNEG_12091 [Monoraphidium neglectum]|eukprot:XP_013894890.1 hypothetical protein MNEG_12091 [Monoraphidium neglectum]
MPLISVACLADSALRAPGPQPVPPYITQAALTTVVATHQLPAAINTLAICVRPLLLSGWGTSDEPAPQIVAEAMMAVLPGIDANDEAKTAAVFQFYTSVLASLPALRGADSEDDDGADGSGGAAPRLPLYLEDWLDQVLERVLLLLGNLDTGPGADRADALHGKADLLPKSTTALTKARAARCGSDTMFSTFFTHLMQRLPRQLARRAVRQLGAFALGPPLPSVALEAAGMYRAAAAVDPEGVVEAVVRPLARRVAGEIPEKAPLLPELLPLIDAGLAAPSRVGQ